MLFIICLRLGEEGLRSLACIVFAERFESLFFFDAFFFDLFAFFFGEVLLDGDFALVKLKDELGAGEQGRTSR